MKNFCLIANKEKDAGFEIASNICKMIADAGGRCDIVSRPEYDNKSTISPTDVSLIADDTECAIILGGDGTLIQAAKDLVDREIPLLGVNLGTLGFMAELENNFSDAINELFNNNYSIENRMMIQGEVKSNNQKIFEDIALNDVVIGRSGFSRIISMNIYVNGEMINTYHGDGVIISTPTGSTGYNLSAGGPIVKPDSKLMVITPICSHSLNSRSIVVDKEDKISICIATSKKTQTEEAIATFDGRRGIDLQAEDIIEISRSKKETKLVKIGKNGFFDIIREKL